MSDGKSAGALTGLRTVFHIPHVIGCIGLYVHERIGLPPKG